MTMTEKGSSDFRDFHETPLGRIVHGDSVDVLAACEDASVDLIMTSPPFGLVRKKDYLPTTTWNGSGTMRWSSGGF